LDPTDVKGLVNHISLSLRAQSSQDRGDGEQFESLPTKSVSGHMALLCLWGMADSVATSLSLSITSAFDDGHHGDDLSLLSPVSDKSKKRKSGRGSSIRKAPSSTNQSELPSLPAADALSVLGEILRGSDPSNVAARERLIATEKARQTLEDALELGMLYAGRMFRMASVNNCFENLCGPFWQIISHHLPSYISTLDAFPHFCRIAPRH
jgi:hypothetical protein